jgi:hypothetical protein
LEPDIFEQYAGEIVRSVRELRMVLLEGWEAVGWLLVRVPWLRLEDEAAVGAQAFEDLGEEGN